MTTINATNLVQPLHALLVHELGLASPLGDAVTMLDNASRLTFAGQQGTATARHARAQIARAIATGERPFDEAALREYDEQSIWVADLNAQSIPASTSLVEEVRQQAGLIAGGLLNMHAPAIFDTLAAEARRVVGILEALPAPPPQLFTTGADQAQMLAKADGHAETYTTLLRTNDRFWTCTRGADLIRDAARRRPQPVPGWRAAARRDLSQLAQSNGGGAGPASDIAASAALALCSRRLGAGSLAAERHRDHRRGAHVRQQATPPSAQPSASRSTHETAALLERSGEGGTGPTEPPALEGRRAVLSNTLDSSVGMRHL